MNTRLYLPAALIALAGSNALAQPCSPNQVSMMVADDGDVGDGYGWAVAIDSTTAVVGSLHDSAGASDSGSVYILTFDGSSWDETQKLTAIGVGTSDGFGDSVAIHNNTIVIGTPGDDDAGSGAGAAYVFTNIKGTWTQTAKLVPSMLTAGDNFASAVDIDNNIIVLSASLTDSVGSNSGAAYVYRFTKGAWIFDTQLVSDDIAEFDHFGIDVAVSGNRVIVGADGDDDNGSTSGSAYIFELDGSTWSQTAKLTANDGAIDDQFGERIDISGSSAIIGARYDDDSANRSGSAYIFELGATWTQHTKLNAFDPTSSKFFGQDVSIHNGRAIVGAWGERDTSGFFNAGAAYAYSRSAGAWALDNKLIAGDQEGGDFYGYSVAVSDDFAIVGADGNDDFWWGPDAGAVYLIELNCVAQCPADLTGDGALDFFDISAFLTLFGAGDPIADFTEDGALDFFDISAFLTAFSAGCP